MLILITVEPALGRISVNRINLRVPKEGDIGLIFDINLINTANEEKELLEYHIRPARECCINLTEKSVTSNGGKILGGSFGNIEPGALQTVSVIWPTTILFNRVGFCDIVINSINVQNEEREVKQQLQFDTRFTKIDSAGNTFRRKKEYLECENWDMNFLKQCEPLNCEEKYLGKRSFYNISTSSCDAVPKCDGKNMAYDIFLNECISPSRQLTASDIEKMKRADNDEEYEDLKNEQSGYQNVIEKSADWGQFIPITSRPTRETAPCYGVISGLIIVLTTITVYIIVCFFIYFLLNWISRPKTNNSE